jgi:putative transposase
MIPLLQRFLLYLAGATESQLRDMVEYLKQENQFLRSRLPERITLTEREKRTLVQLGQKLGTALKELITIVSYRTFCRWIGQESKKRKVVRKRGRPPTPEQIRELILRIAGETGWGLAGGG